ncbi:hypothetical protein BCR36DRAFT_412840 [Piromyces finnis]|uniref:Uncharacterized protein n=1 Tax=Piromyces finnis TaxID=1754191 RepID=A0A1Y1V7Q4_9FUNG|nr:hypothetical protein BCR36DRAFT_412840 [Piromyces finnis]|eukprot:ORX49325.1 hypothetical protein BCR36DRAFT_412840 [Piromyces finnis]
MNTANSDSDINHYLHQGQTDYISYNRLYNEVLDKVKKGLESQGSGILKKNNKNDSFNTYSKPQETIHPKDIALFQEDDSDDSDSDDFLEWENSDNESVYNSRFRGGLTRAKSNINDVNDYNTTNKTSTNDNLDIVKDRIVLNKHFQKIYGFNDSSFRHGSYEMYNSHQDEENDSDNESINDNVHEKDLNNGNNNDDDENSVKEEEKEEKTMRIENTMEDSPEKVLPNENENDIKMTKNEKSMNHHQSLEEPNNDLEKEFYNELRRASMIIDLQQHYRLRDGLKNKEDLKQEIVEGYNSLHNKNYSSEDLPDFQNIDKFEDVEAKIIDHHDTIGNTESNNIANESISILKDINEATKNRTIKNGHDEDNKDTNQLINDTWKFLFNNPYSIQFLSKSLPPSKDKLFIHDIDETTINLPPNTESITTEKWTEEENKKMETTEASTSKYAKYEFDNSLMTNTLRNTIKNEEKLRKDREEEEMIRKNKENDWLSFVQKELANMNLSSTSTSYTNKETEK